MAGVELLIPVTIEGRISPQFIRVLTYVETSVYIAIRCGICSNVTLVGRTVAIAIKIALIGNTVAIAIVGSQGHFATIEQVVIVAVRPTSENLACVRHTVVIAVFCGSIGDVALIGNTVEVAIGTGSIGNIR